MLNGIDVRLIFAQAIVCASTLLFTNVSLALPNGFSNESILDNLAQPVDLAYLPDGSLLVLERRGTIVHTDPTDLQPTANSYITLPFVDDDGEKGLLSIALDPEFEQNNYFYLYYHNSSTDRARVSRFTHDIDSSSPSTEFLIWEDDLDTSTQIVSDHWGGAFDFGPDGYLYLGIGDKKDNPQDSQDLTKSAGKILRFNTAGASPNQAQWDHGSDNAHLIPADNPWVDGVGGNQDAIWALGLRNPFRGRWDTLSDRFFIGEVGGNVGTGEDASYEDVHVLSSSDAAANFGFPVCEGPNCAGAPPVNYSPPVFSVQHPSSFAIIVGPLYRGTQFPSEYNEALFFTDYAHGFLKYVKFTDDGSVTSDTPVGGFPFADKDELGVAPVSIIEGLDGALYYIDIFRNAGSRRGKLKRIVYNDTNAPPVIEQVVADPVSANFAPLEVLFSATAIDPEGTPLTYNWSFGDGTSGTGSTVLKNYTSKGSFRAVLRVSDELSTTTSAPIDIEIGAPPSAEIIEPSDGFIFRAGEVVTFRGVGSDPDGELNESSFRWTINFRHNTHVHPILSDVPGVPCAPSGSTCIDLEIPGSGHDFSESTSYEVNLQVIDSDGSTANDQVVVIPDEIDLTINSNVPGGVVTEFDQLPRQSPFTLDTLIGFAHSIEVPDSVTAIGETYQFVGWSDGLFDRQRNLIVPDQNQTLTATYENIGVTGRASDGLTALYTFNEGSGDTVFDSSDFGTPLNLIISEPDKVSWGSGTLSTIESTRIESDVGARKINAAIKASNAITVEAWIAPSSDTQSGPAPIMTLSTNPFYRNVALHQNADSLEVNLGTTRTGNQGNSPLLMSPSGVVMTDLMHVVYTRDAAEVASLYINNVLVETTTIDGDMSNWQLNRVLALGNERRYFDRPWLGSYDLLAFYDRALDVSEVNQNYVAGPDGEGLQVSENNPPLAVSDAVETDENSVLAGNVLIDNGSGFDTDVDGDTLVVAAVDGLAADVGVQLSLASGALVTVDANGDFSYDPNGVFDNLGEDEQSQDSFDYTISDARSGESSATVTITINGVDVPNAAPIAASDSFAADADSLVVGNVLIDNGSGPDIDTDGDTLVVAEVNGLAADVGFQVTLTSGALVAIEANGDFSYDPNGVFDGLAPTASATDSFDYTLSDGQDAIDTATVTISISALNQYPVAQNDILLTDEDTPLNANLFANNGGAGADTDANGDTMMVTMINGDASAIGVVITLPSGALLEVSGDGSISYDPANQFESLDLGEQAIDTFTYMIADGRTGSSSATVTIAIDGVDESLSLPRISNGVVALYNFNEGSGDTVEDVSGVGTPLNLFISEPDKVSWGLGTLSTIESTRIESDVGARKINTAIKASNAITVEAWIAPSSVTQSGPAPIMTLSTNPFYRNVALHQNADSLEVNLGTTRTGNQGNSPLLMSPSGVVMTDLMHVVYTRDAAEVASLYINNVLVETTTIDGDMSNWQLNRVLALGNERRYFDRPWLGSYDLLAFYDRALDVSEVNQNYVAGPDGEGLQVSENNPPLAVSDAVETDENSVLAGNVLIDNGSGFDTDVDGDTLVVAAVDGLAADVGVQLSLASGALVTVDANGDFSYDPNGVFDNLGEDEQSQDSFDYTISDARSGESSATVTITINGVDVPNAAPIAASDSFAADADSLVVGNVLIDNGSGPDIDTDGDTLVVAEVNGLAADVGFQVTLTSGALVAIEANGDFSYDPNGVFDGLAPTASATDSFDYTLSDGQDAIDTATVTISISALNQYPVAQNDILLTDEDTPLNANLFANNGGAGADTDANGDTMMVTMINGDASAIGVVITLPSGALLEVSGDGSISYDPANQFESLDLGEQAIDTFTYMIADGRTGSSSATVTIAIDGVDESLSLPRISNGVVALYNFNEGSGDTVEDVSGVGTPLNLFISEPDKVSWGLGTLSTIESTRIESDVGARKINTAIKASNAITVEAWIAPSSVTQSGPAPIMTLSTNPFYRNVALHQNADSLEVNLGTTRTGNQGNSPLLMSPSGVVMTDLMHVVYTRDAAEVASLYINNVLVETTTIDGDMSNWQLNRVLALGNERRYFDRPWLGSYDLLAFYDRALDVSEVNQNYVAGPDGEGFDDTAMIDLPSAQDDNFATSADLIVEGNVFSDNGAGPDTNVNDGSLSIIEINEQAEVVGLAFTLPSGALLLLEQNGNFTYDPNGQFADLVEGNQSVDSFQYTLSDANENTVSATVSVTVAGVAVTPLNTAPVAINDVFEVFSDNVLTGDVFLDNGQGSDSDAEGGVLSVVSINGAPLNGSNYALASGANLLLSSNGEFTYDPNGQFDDLLIGEHLIDSFDYVISDGALSGNLASVDVRVMGVNEEQFVECPIFDKPLVSYFTFDSSEQGVFPDMLQIQNVAASNVEIQSGLLRNAIALNDASNVSLDSYHPASDLGLTIGAWVYPENFDTVEARFVSKASGTNGPEHVIMVGTINGDALRFRLKTDGSVTTLVSANGLLQANSWNFVAFTYDLEFMRIFLNGSLVAQVEKTGAIAEDLITLMAIGNQPADAGSRPFVGLMDDLRFYNGGLTAAQVNELFNYRPGSCDGGASRPIALSLTSADRVANLSWQIPLNEDATQLLFEVFRDGVGIANMVPHQFYSDINLNPGATYVYTVRSTDSLGGVSSFSDPISITIPAEDTQAPDRPANVVALTLTPNEVTLAWDNSSDSGGSGTAGYLVSKDGEFVEQVVEPVFTDVNVGPLENHFYEISAVDNASSTNVSESTRIDITTPDLIDTEDPSIPTQLEISSTTINSIVVSWFPSVDQGSAGLAGYRIYRDAVFIGTTADTFFEDRGLGAESSYTYEISAIDSATPFNESSVATISGQTDGVVFDGDLPLGGEFYGNYEYGLNTGNAAIAILSSRRFRAEKSGDVVAMRYNNRTLTDEVIQNRCASGSIDSVWCDCVTAQLDRFTCGYTLSNSYSVGNGGSIVVELRDDTNGVPGDTVLATTGVGFVPLDNSFDAYPILTFESPATLSSGSVYHLVFNNFNPPTDCPLNLVSPSEAGACPSDQGAIGLNGITFAQNAYDNGIDPFRGGSAANLKKKSYDENEPWIKDENTLSWYEVQYSNGSWVGDSYAAFDSIATGVHEVEGLIVARQMFEIDQSNRLVDGLWLNFGHSYIDSANGTDLNVTLRDASGSVLATGSIHSSETCRIQAVVGHNAGDNLANHCRDWGYTDLSSTVSLQQGSVYSVEFRAEAGAGFILAAAFPLNYGAWDSTSRNHWNDSRAEISFDNGSTWQDWSATRVGRDLALLFTIVGEARFLQ